MSNLRQVLIHFFDPLWLISDAELRRFFIAPATFIFSALVFAFALLVWGSVWVVEVRTQYEVIAQIPAGSSARFVSASGDDATQLRLTAGAPVRLVLGTPGSSAPVLVRDKYGLRTIEALVLQRGFLGYSMVPCDIAASDSPEAWTAPVLVDGARRTGPRELDIVGPLRWSDHRVRTPLTLADGRASERGWLRAGDGHDGPEQGAPPWAQRYLERLYRERDVMAEWASRPAYDDGARRVVRHSIEGYDLEVEFDAATHSCTDTPVPSREATVLSAVEIVN